MSAPAARLADLPHALIDPAVLAERLGGRRLAVFLDYDGTLTSIVDDPATAIMADAARAAVQRLASRCPVAIVSGRDRADVEALVAIPDLVYAGSHGFDIAGPGRSHQHEGGVEAQALLVSAADVLDRLVGEIPGVIVERKRFAVAVHFRMAAEGGAAAIEEAIEGILASGPGLRRTTGKMVVELRPDLEWDKGRALRFLLGELDLDRSEVVPIYLGDDDTDEDAFREIHDDGLGIIVGTEDRGTAAHVRVDDPAQAVELLDRLAELAGDA